MPESLTAPCDKEEVVRPETKPTITTKTALGRAVLAETRRRARLPRPATTKKLSPRRAVSAKAAKVPPEPPAQKTQAPSSASPAVAFRQTFSRKVGFENAIPAQHAASITLPKENFNHFPKSAESTTQAKARFSAGRH